MEGNTQSTKDKIKESVIDKPIDIKMQSEPDQAKGCQPINDIEPTTDKDNPPTSDEVLKGPLKEPSNHQTQPELIETKPELDKVKPPTSNEGQESSLKEQNTSQWQPELNEAMKCQTSINVELTTEKDTTPKSNEAQETPLKELKASHSQPELNETMECQPSINVEPTTSRDRPPTSNEAQESTHKEPIPNQIPTKPAQITKHPSSNEQTTKENVKVTNDNKAQPDQGLTASNQPRCISNKNIDLETSKQTDVKVTGLATTETAAKAQIQVELVENILNANDVTNVPNKTLEQNFMSPKVKKSQILDVMHKLGLNMLQNKDLLENLVKKYCVPEKERRKWTWLDGPVEEINLDDDEKSCKILSVQLPKGCGRGHIRALMLVKSTYDPFARYTGIASYKQAGISFKSLAYIEFLIRFLTHAECMKVYKKWQGIKLDNRPLNPELDIGYKKAKHSGLIGPKAELNIKLYTNKISLYEYRKITNELNFPNSENRPVYRMTYPPYNSKTANEKYNFAADITDVEANLSDISSDGSNEKTLKKEEDHSNETGTIDESDKNHCRIIRISNLPKKATYNVMKNLVRCHTSYGNQPMELRVTFSGVALMQCTTHDKAVQLVKELNGFLVEGQKIELKLDIGHEATRTLLPQHRQFLMGPRRIVEETPNVKQTQKKIESSTSKPVQPQKKLEPSTSNQEQTKRKLESPDVIVVEETPVKKAKYEPPKFDVSKLPIVFMPPRDFNPDTYGLSKDFLQSLSIRPPLTEIVHVLHLHPAVDEAKLNEVFSMAGNIKHLKIEKCKARIVYDHPVEAVQAIALFNKQTLFNRELFVKMDFSNIRPLPLGLQSIGTGLGSHGDPLPGVRNHVEIKQIQHLLYKMGQLNEVPLTGPFNVTYVNPYVEQNTFGKKVRPHGGCPPNNNPNNNPNVPANARNQIIPQSSPNTPNQVDASIATLGAILAQHGLIDQNSKCQDVNSILDALRNNRDKSTHTLSGNNDAHIINTATTNAYSGPNVLNNQNFPNTDPTNNLVSPNTQYNQLNMVPNSGIPVMVPDAQNFTPNLVPNAVNMVPNAPNISQNAPNAWQSNMSQPTVRWDQTPAMIPQVTNTVPAVQNYSQFGMAAQVQNISPQVQNMTQQVQNMIRPVQHMTPPIQPNMALPVQNIIPSVQNMAQSVQNTQQNFNQNNQGNQNYNQNIQQQYHQLQQQQQQQQKSQFHPQQKYEAPSKQKDQDRYDNQRTEKQKGFEDSASNLLIFNNLPPSVTADALNSKMREVGAVVFGELTGQGRAIVRFRHAEDAARCVKLFHRSKVDGQMIEVSFV